MEELACKSTILISYSIHVAPGRTIIPLFHELT
jgi:hypothetical protein